MILNNFWLLCLLVSSKFIKTLGRLESSVFNVTRNEIMSFFVAPCFRSYSIVLLTFVTPPYFLYILLWNLEAPSGSPLRYFTTMSCMCLTFHSFIGKIFCVKNWMTSKKEKYNYFGYLRYESNSGPYSRSIPFCFLSTIVRITWQVRWYFNFPIKRQAIRWLFFKYFSFHISMLKERIDS